MQIPEAILLLAKELIISYGNNFQYLGIYEGKDMYKFQFPTGERTGFPFVYLYDKRTDAAEEITGFKALNILRCVKSF